MAAWILIADDVASDLHKAEKALKNNGFRVTALNSGRELLDYLHSHHTRPDLILMDLLMKKTNGFEILQEIREMDQDGEKIPVILMSSDAHAESEAKSLRLGATDFVRKPFDPDALVSRVQNAVWTQEKLHGLEKDAITDQMTGLLNKNTIEERVSVRCSTDNGFLCVLDLDCFKLINDLYGHDTGDRALVLFAELLRRNLRAEDLCGRIGGDEFILFLKNMPSEEVLRKFCDRINAGYLKVMEQELGAPLKLPLGVSFGAAEVPAQGREFDRLFHLADQALLTVKLEGKHGCAMAGSQRPSLQDTDGALNLEAVTMIMEERNVSASAMWMGKEAFINIYRYMTRYMERYHGAACRVLFTLTPDTDVTDAEKSEISDKFRYMVQTSLRNSDVMVEVSENQIFLLLPEMHEANVHVVIERLMNRWNRFELHGKAKVTWESGNMELGDDGCRAGDVTGLERVVIADSDPESLKQVQKILSRAELQVTAVDSGSALLNFLKDNDQDLILLDFSNPGTEGPETLKRIKSLQWQCSEVPVIVLTDDRESGMQALALGAEDIILKPFVPELLANRTRRTIELFRLRTVVSDAVQRRE